VPNVKHLDDALAHVELVIDHERAMHELADAGPFWDRPAHAREAGKQFDMVKQRVSERRRGSVIVVGNAPDDFGEIA
jgi:hypothetical protein